MIPSTHSAKNAQVDSKIKDIGKFYNIYRIKEKVINNLV